MENWKTLLAQGVRDIERLKEQFRLTEEDILEIQKIQDVFPMFINPYYLSLINFSDPDDPVRKMSIPSVFEASREGTFDTSGEKDNTVLTGLQHKYTQTALILSTNQCAMYCRHCFRKRLVGLSEEEVSGHLGEMASYIASHPEITNVLISGGDAFMNSNETIRQYLAAFCDIPHLDLIRFGTRTPVVLPQRITSDPELRDILGEYSKKKKIYVVTQYNHPREITPESEEAVKMLTSLGVHLRNQTVLLKGVNDNEEILGELLRRLTAIGVIPYYIFQCRPVTGVLNQFQVPLRKGYAIVQNAMQKQNGQGKSFRFIMSHPAGKIEILGMEDDDNMLFKYHQAKDPADYGRIFKMPVGETQCWL